VDKTQESALIPTVAFPDRQCESNGEERKKKREEQLI
jgi:hypothetical protein